ncbi:MAG: response regulator [Deltaproteobacteria bacterium]|nr:response regulator [Deltaproteobacteria bacterium]
MREHLKILIVDDTPFNIRVLNDLLKADYDIYAANNGAEALRLVPQIKPDLILLDIMMPEMDGYEVCRRLKADKNIAAIPVLFVTAKIEAEDETRGLELGAVDYITKPINPAVVIARIKVHINLHRYQEHLEEMVAEKTRQLRDGYVETVRRLVLTSEFKDEDTGAHIKRISYCTRELAMRMGLGREFAENIFYASPMHDIGKVAIPDAILLKKGPLDDAEWLIMKTHAAIGAQILAGSVSPYLRMAVDIAGCHHERWDGSGYPQGLKGEAIPLTARIMNITDQYDALRSKRPYKPAFDHDKVVSIITEGDGRTMAAHFDPDVLSAFKRSLDIFRDIYDSHI